MTRLALEDFGTPGGGRDFAHRTMAAAPESPSDRFDDGYNAGWDDAMAQVEADRTRVGQKLGERLASIARTQEEATAAVLAALEPALRDVFDKLLPRAAERSFLPVLIEEIETLLTGDTGDLTLLVSPEEISATRHLLERSDIPRATVTVAAEPALSLSQALIRWQGQERQLDLEGTLAGLDEALETFLATLDRPNTAAPADTKEAVNG